MTPSSPPPPNVYTQASVNQQQQAQQQQQQQQAQPTSFYDRSFRICTLFSIPIEIHYLFPIYIFFDLISYASRGSETGLWLLFGLTKALILFLIVLIHEFGHAGASRMIGGWVHKILLWPLGGLAYCGGAESRCDQIKISLAGPLTHIPMGLIWMGLIVAVGGVERIGFTFPAGSLADNFGINLCIEGFIINVFLMAFNLLLPAYPLDGGKIFASLLTMKFSRETSAKAVVGVSIPLSLALVGFGIWQIVQGYTLSLTVFIGLWMLWQSYQLFDLVRTGQVHRHPLFQYDQ